MGTVEKKNNLKTSWSVVLVFSVSSRRVEHFYGIVAMFSSARFNRSTFSILFNWGCQATYKKKKKTLKPDASLLVTLIIVCNNIKIVTNICHYCVHYTRSFKNLTEK